MTVDYEARKWKLIEQIAESSPSSNIYGEWALANLGLNRRIKESNEQLRNIARWFDQPHPHGRDHKGECDFAAMKLCHVYYRFANSKFLEAETVEQIKRFFLNYDFQSLYHSENHHLLFHTSRYLMARALPQEWFAGYGRAGVELVQEDRTWLDRFIRFRAKRGWGEFDSTMYIWPEVECLLNLYDFAGDEEIAQLAEMMLDVLLADFAVESLNGMCGGAHGRIYGHHALDYAQDVWYSLQYLYFGDVQAKEEKSSASQIPDVLFDFRGGCPVDAALSDYRPHELVSDIALKRNEAYENRERKHLHNMDDVLPVHPLDGSIRKYTYWTPQYVMGCVQYQDHYPDIPSAIYAHHEQHQWDLTFGTRTTARIFTHHPGNSGCEHGYWTGDLGCGLGCGHFFQHKSALIALYDIGPDQPYQFIHGYVPRHDLDEVVEQDGFLFIREGQVYAALKLLNGYRWAVEGEWKDREVFSNGSRNGVICEVGLVLEHESFEAFQLEIANNTIRFDRERMTLDYVSKKLGTLHMDVTGARKLNGNAIDLSYESYDSPYMKSKWDSGVVEIMKDEKRLMLDFS